MTLRSATTPASEAPEVRAAFEAFSTISESLLEGYRALEERAELVERELAHANRELESKLDELDAVKRKLEAVLQALPTGVVVRDRDGRIARINPAAARLIGFDGDDVGAGASHPDPLGLLSARADGVPREVVRGDGRRLVIASRRSPVPGADGRADGSVEILDDRTELTELADRLHVADKMAALGTMAGGIAHEIRNPMNGIMGFAALLRSALPEGRERRWASLIVEGCAEADAIIASLLTLAQPERLALENVEPLELLESSVAAAQGRGPNAPDPSRWSIELDCTAPTFRADRIQLRQALRNLIANAMDVLPEGGRVRVSAKAEGDELVFRVADSGPGLSDEARQRVFDPFYTTRADGTGLGLALVAALARAHGGSVRVERGPLGGAEFTLRIPHTKAP
jgi:signal transduction histidine kinase